MDIELQQLRILHTVAETGSINSAAEELGMSQSGVSRVVQRLERAAGLPVLHRQPSGITLTTAGAILLEHADTVLPAVNRMFTDVRRCLATDDGKLSARLGAAPAPTLTPFVRCAEDLGIAPMSLLVDESGQRLVQLLGNEEIDVAMFHHFPELDPAPPEPVRHEQIAAQNPYLCLPDTHPFAARAAVGLADLRDEHVVLPYPECQPLTGHFHTACAAAGIRPRVSSANSASAAVALGHALGAITFTYWPDIHREARMAHVALRDTPLHTVLLLAWRQDGPLDDELGGQLVASVRAMHSEFVATACGTRRPGA
ncbi:LysR family transcriptional regulator [Pilimelia terevasa]|uniref:LysR family transcriptional regulator n=1 Tax=Pilimelia terevasa TaxID=53372 RepID=A0A8J3FG03_9ACTN|nr:LysR family transcriptional regulator [Pilimelia terevasa]GGK20220.1 LysR family transcriptional regulator [Pilimelia terevasa]